MKCATTGPSGVMVFTLTRRGKRTPQRDRGLIALANDYQSTKLAGGDVVAGKDHVFAAHHHDKEKGANEDR